MKYTHLVELEVTREANDGLALSKNSIEQFREELLKAFQTAVLSAIANQVPLPRGIKLIGKFEITD